MKIKNYLIYCLIFVIMFCFTSNVKAVYSDDKIGNYETEFAKFPNSYKSKIESLHNIYPNAIFVVQDKFFDWSSYREVSVDWNNMLKAQSGARSLIESSANSKYVGSKYEGNWNYATTTGIVYYMNPYNFLDEKHVFMFESQYYKDYHILDGVNKILSGTFMANKKCAGSNKTYAEVIMEAAVKYNVSPYMLTARLRQENGSGTSALVSGNYSKLTDGIGDVNSDGKIDRDDLLIIQSYVFGYSKTINKTNADINLDTKIDRNDLLSIQSHVFGYSNISGYKNLYNYFNIGASGDTKEEIIINGLKKAKQMGWTTPYLSIIGGAKFIEKEYIGVNDTYNVKGQMTNYLQKWDPYGPKLGLHQYMQNIRAPYFESESTYRSYSSFKGYKDYKYIFYIPIFNKAPNT